MGRGVLGPAPRSLSMAGTWLLLATLSSPAASQETIDISEQSQRLAIGSRAEFLEDPEGKLSLAAVRQSGDFQPCATDRRNLGYPNATIWLRFSLKSRASRPLARFVVLGGTPNLAELYGTGPDGSTTRQVSGRALHRDKRPIVDLELIFPLQLLPRTRQTYYLRLKTDDTLRVGPSIWSPRALIAAVGLRWYWLGAYYGIMLAMTLYNLFIFTLVRDRVYLFYVLFQASFALCQLSLDEIAFVYLWPDHPQWAAQSEVLFASLAFVGGIAFARDLLDTSRITPGLDRLLRGLLGLAGALTAAALFSGARWLRQVELVFLLLSAVALMVSAVAAWRRGSRNAPFFIVAWLIFLSGCLIYPLTLFGLLPHTPMTALSAKVGSAIEAILLSLALANRIRLMREQRAAAQAALLKSREEAAQTLERRVEARTSELADALERLKAAQTRLVHQARMASLGHLVAGVAHEVGNPLNFALGGAQDLDRRLGQLSKRLGAIGPDSIGEDTVEALRASLVSADKALGLVSEGCRRINGIVEQLRNYAQPAAAETQAVDLNKELDTTLALVASRLEHQGIDVEREVEGCPLALCGRGAIGQVLMNLILNSCRAMPDGGRIHVQIQEAADQVLIRFSDTGPGIAPEAREAIFDPFFTAWPSAEGTGLGLSICHEILQVHDGKIELANTGRSGAAFLITLPRATQSQPGDGQR